MRTRSIIHSFKKDSSEDAQSQTENKRSKSQFVEPETLMDKLDDETSFKKPKYENSFFQINDFEHFFNPLN